MEKNLLHVQVPNNFRDIYDVSPNDLLIYVCIKRHMNKDTHLASPSLKKISEESGASIPTVQKSVATLKGKYFDIIKNGRTLIYVFNKDYKNYEPFSYEFLDNEELTFLDKAGIIASLEFMFKDTKGLGKISYTNKELAEKMNVSESYVERFNRSLKNKGILLTVPTKKVDPDTGLLIKEKVYNLQSIGQAIIWKLNDHEIQIQENTEEISKHDKDIEMLTRRIEELEKENKKLKNIDGDLIL